MKLLYNYLLFISIAFAGQVLAKDSLKTLIYTNPYGGLGDVYSAVKTAIFMADQHLDVALYVDISDESNRPLRNSEQLRNVKEIVEKRQITFITSHDQAFDFKADNLFVVTGKPLRSSFGAKRAFIIYEYNQKSLLTPSMFQDPIHVTEIETGFNKNGIFIMNKDKIAAIMPIATWVQNNPLKLGHLPKKVQDAFAGGDYMFGYANGRNHGFDLNAYIAGGTRYAIHQGMKDIVFFLAGDVNTSMGNSNLFDFIDEDSFASLSVYSISGQTTYNNVNGTPMNVEEKTDFPNNNGINLYIIRGRVDNDDFLSLLKGSKYPFALVTGDQSLSEALSLGKVPIYQSLSHKDRVIPGLEEKMSLVDRTFAVLIDKMTLSHTLKDGWEMPSNIAQTLFECIEDVMNHKDDYQRKIIQVTRENNIFDALKTKLVEFGILKP